MTCTAELLLWKCIEYHTGSFGVCLDTCHAFAAGYDLRTENGVNETLDKFSSEVGLKNLTHVYLISLLSYYKISVGVGEILFL